MKNIKKLLTALFCLTLSLGMVACAPTGENSTQGSSAGESSVVETPESSSSAQEPEEPESSSSAQEPEEPESSSSVQEPEEPEEPEKATYKVTFKQEGQEDQVFDVKEGEDLTDVPTPVGKTGYSVVWDVTDFSNITADVTVNVVVTPMNYVITYNAKGGEAVESQTVTFDAEYTLASTSRDNYEFTGWYVADENGNATETKLEDGTWAIADNVTVVAGWDFIDGEYAAKYNFNVDGLTFITKEAYEGGCTVSFKYFIPEGTTTSWFGIAWHYAAEEANIYHAAGVENPVGYLPITVKTGVWTTVEFELPEDDAYYLYFGSPVCNDTNPIWKLDGEDSYILFDNFKIGEVTEDFNGGVEDSIFNVLIDGAVTFADGILPFEEGEYAMRYTFNAGGEEAPFITKKAYDAGSKVSFKYFIPEGTTAQWWGVGYTEDANSIDYYAAATNGIDKALGAWTTHTFTLPASGGPYYVYISSEVGNWKLNGDNAYVFIDDFTVGSDVEDFNKDMDEWALTVRTDAVKLSEKGEGYVAPVIEEQNYGAKLLIDDLSSTKTTPSFITKDAYAGGGTVTFDYYMTGNTNNKWWAFFWTNDPAVASIYAHVENNKENNDGRDLPVAQDSWATATVNIPEGNWYFYLAGARGEWTGGHVILDNVVIKDANGNVLATETFNRGFEESIFNNNRAHAVLLAEGKPEAVQGNTMLAFNEASIGGNERIAMVTAGTYAGVTEISFKAVYLETAVSPYWGLSYTTDPTKFSYDDNNLAAVNCYTPKFGNLKTDAGVYTYRLVVADGTWTMYANDEEVANGAYTDGNNYFYFVINPKNGTDLAFYMEDFTITYSGGTVTDTFDNSESSLFVESATVIGTGYGSSGMSFVESTFEN